MASAPLDLCYVDATTGASTTCAVLTMSLDSQTACTDVGQLLAGLLPSSSSLGVPCSLILVSSIVLADVHRTP